MLWLVTGSREFPVEKYVAQVLSRETEDAGQGLERWLVQTCEGQIEQLMRDPRVVKVVPGKMW